VVIVDSILKSIISVESIKLEVLKILMFVTSGEKDILKDNDKNINNINTTV
jgi:hypothetical protein